MWTIKLELEYIFPTIWLVMIKILEAIVHTWKRIIEGQLLGIKRLLSQKEDIYNNTLHWIQEFSIPETACHIKKTLVQER